MTDLPYLTSEQVTLINAAHIAVFAPERWPSGNVSSGAHTTVRAGRRVLRAFRFEIRASNNADLLEVHTLVRDMMPGGGADMHALLEREARAELAMRSLDLAENAAESLAVPLDRLILEREAALPETRPRELEVDGTFCPGNQLAYDDHHVVWCDLPDRQVALVMHARGIEPPAVVSVVPPSD